MNSNFFVLTFLISFNILNVYGQQSPGDSCITGITLNPDFRNAEKIRDSLNELINSGVPGTAIAIFSDGRWWVSSAGFASIEKGVKMDPCHLQYLQSISKTYMATAILKLVEEERLDLDQSIDHYLPLRYSRYITDNDKITVRMLLNHTSGVPEYNYQPAYVTYLLQHPAHHFKPRDYFEYINGKPLDFEPGSEFSYRNSNYVLLALIADAITGDHAQYISDNIFKPLGLKNTYYKNEAGYPHFTELVTPYWDRYSNGIVENIDELQRTNVASMIGDDGIVTTPVDAVLFLKGLLEGKIISDSYVNMMKEWVRDNNNEIRYGLGLDHSEINNHIAYGHSGGGLGAGSELYYFPDKEIYVFVAINLGTVTGSPLHIKASEARENLFDALLNQ